MKYDIQFKPKAVKDIENLPSRIQGRVLAQIEEMSDIFKEISKGSPILPLSIAFVLAITG
jgi:mRNA-degrading endonuclease RelE of RelBE toxin-antitoxin system